MSCDLMTDYGMTQRLSGVFRPSSGRRTSGEVIHTSKGSWQRQPVACAESKEVTAAWRYALCHWKSEPTALSLDINLEVRRIQGFC